MRVPISEEHPVIIDARECEQAGKVYTLRGDVQIQFADYIFHGDLVTYDSASGDVTAKGHVSLDGGRRDIHISGSEGSLQPAFADGQVLRRAWLHRRTI